MVESFQILFSLINIRLGDQLLVKNVIENFDFQTTFFLKMYPIFVAFAHNFGRSDGDTI